MRRAIAIACGLLSGCEAVVDRCADDRVCDNGAIVTCRVDCDRNGNRCQKSFNRIECTSGSVQRTCSETANGPTCVDVGVTCNSSTDKTRCDGDSIVTCVQNHSSTMVCPVMQTCHLDQSGDGFCVDKPKVSCDPMAYPICVDTNTVQQCIGGGPDGFAVLTFDCGASMSCISGLCQ